MAPSVNREEVIEQVEEVLALWEKYDDTGDFSHLVEADIIGDGVVHCHPGEPPIEGKADFIEFFESIDPSEYEWSIELDEATIGRDLVIARSTYRGWTSSEESPTVEGTGIDAFARESDGSLKQILSIPNSNG